MPRAGRAGVAARGAELGQRHELHVGHLLGAAALPGRQLLGRVCDLCDWHRQRLLPARGPVRESLPARNYVDPSRAFRSHSFLRKACQRTDGLSWSVSEIALEATASWDAAPRRSERVPLLGRCSRAWPTSGKSRWVQRERLCREMRRFSPFACRFLFWEQFLRHSWPPNEAWLAQFLVGTLPIARFARGAPSCLTRRSAFLHYLDAPLVGEFNRNIRGKLGKKQCARSH